VALVLLEAPVLGDSLEELAAGLALSADFALSAG
jgi:hypothetical protein